MSVTTQLIESPAMRAVIQERDDALAALTNGIKGAVSIVIPCYQQSQYLEDALKSVEAQTVQPLETLVIDDGSDETHAQKIRELCDQYGATYVRVTNRGLPNARNTGLMLARGEWFLGLDSDDWLEPTFIEKTLAEAEYQRADVVQVGLQEHGARTGAFFPGYDMPLSSVTYDALEHTNRLFYCALMRTRVLREIGGWNGRMIWGWEDWDVWKDMYRRGGIVFAGCQEILFNYRVKPESMAVEAEQHRQWNLDEMRRHHLPL